MLKVSAARRDSLRGGTSADENDLRNCWGGEEFGAESARSVTRGFVGEAGDLGGGESDRVEVGAARIGIFPVTRVGLCGEIHQDLPEAGFITQGARDFLQRAGLRSGFFADA